jgi:hypothetical protein
MTTHVTRTRHITAIQWDGEDETVDRIEALIGAARFECPDPEDDGSAAGVLTDPHSSWREVYTGSWVIRRDDGQITVLSADQFADAYVELGDS